MMSCAVPHNIVDPHEAATLAFAELRSLASPEQTAGLPAARDDGGAACRRAVIGASRSETVVRQAASAQHGGCAADDGRASFAWW